MLFKEAGEVVYAAKAKSFGNFGEIEGAFAYHSFGGIKLQADKIGKRRYAKCLK